MEDIKCIACGRQLRSEVVIFCNKRCLGDWYGNHARIGIKLSLNVRFKLAIDVAKERRCHHMSCANMRPSR